MEMYNGAQTENCQHNSLSNVEMTQSHHLPSSESIPSSDGISPNRRLELKSRYAIIENTPIISQPLVEGAVEEQFRAQRIVLPRLTQTC
jgi:hypothetical protein